MWGSEVQVLLSAQQFHQVRGSFGASSSFSGSLFEVLLEPHPRHARLIDMPALMEDARTLWEFHQMHHELRDTDVAIGLGSHDIGVGTRRVLDMLVGDTQRL